MPMTSSHVMSFKGKTLKSLAYGSAWGFSAYKAPDFQRHNACPLPPPSPPPLTIILNDFLEAWAQTNKLATSSVETY